MIPKEVTDLIHLKSCESHRPDNSSYKALLYKDECDISAKTGLSLLEIEIAALENDIIPQRYSRNQKTLSNLDQLQLLKSHVAVVGLGGLGGSVTELLGRIGIGTLTLIDGDCFDESNLNRQLLSSISSLAKSKAGVAAQRIADINPAIRTHVYKEFLTVDNGRSFLKGADLAADCLDTISDRFTLQQCCKDIKIPMISAAIAGTSGQVTILLPNGAGLEKIYGKPSSAPKRGIESAIGTLGFGASYIAAVECAAIVAQLLGSSSELCEGLFVGDVADYSSEVIRFA